MYIHTPGTNRKVLVHTEKVSWRRPEDTAEKEQQQPNGVISHTHTRHENKEEASTASLLLKQRTKVSLKAWASFRIDKWQIFYKFVARAEAGRQAKLTLLMLM